MVDHVGDRAHRQAMADRVAQVDDEHRHALTLLLHIGQWRGARQQDHQVGMLDARDPDLLAVDNIAAVFLDRQGLDLGGVGAGGRLGHAHRLQAQFAGGDLGQVALLLRVAAMTQQRAHVVHLAVAGPRVATRAVDLLHDHRGLGQAQARTPVLLRDQRSHPPGFGQRIDKGLRVGAPAVDLAVVGVGELGAQRTHGVADVLVAMVGMIGHGVQQEVRNIRRWLASSASLRGRGSRAAGRDHPRPVGRRR